MPVRPIVGAHLDDPGLPLFGIPVPVDVDVNGAARAVGVRLTGEAVVAVAQLPDIADVGVTPLRLCYDGDPLLGQLPGGLVVGGGLGPVVAGALGDVVELADLRGRDERLYGLGVLVDYVDSFGQSS